MQLARKKPLLYLSNNRFLQLLQKPAGCFLSICTVNPAFSSLAGMISVAWKSKISIHVPEGSVQQQLQKQTSTFSHLLQLLLSQKHRFWFHVWRIWDTCLHWLLKAAKKKKSCSWRICIICWTNRRCGQRLGGPAAGYLNTDTILFLYFLTVLKCVHVSSQVSLWATSCVSVNVMERRWGQNGAETHCSHRVKLNEALS